MDNNLHNFTGQVEFVKERKNPNQSWGSFSVRVLQRTNSFQFAGQEVRLNSPTIWMNIKADYENNVLKRNSKYVLDCCEKKKFIFVTLAKISNYEAVAKDDKGVAIAGAPPEIKYTLEAGSNACYFSDVPYYPINISTVIGTVKEHNGPKLRLEVPYASKEGLKFKEVCVRSDHKYDHTLFGKRIFVSGEIFGKTPNGVDSIYIVAKTIEILK